MLAGDKGEANLGLDHATWQRLADTVDLIVDPAALVNHVLPYSELFGPNVVGTAELIRIALTTRIKPYIYVSTIGVGDQIEPGKFVEEADVRQMSPTRKIGDTYANGYGNSKWAGEVLLREAQRPVRSAGVGVPLRHDHGRHHLCRTAQRAGHVHPHDAVAGGRPGSRRTRSTSSTRTATGNAPTSTGCPWNSSPMPSRHSVQTWSRASRPTT